MSDAKPPMALGIVGDFYHPREALVALFRKAAPEIAWNFALDAKSVDWVRIDDYSLLVIAAENRLAPESSDELWMDEAIAQGIERYVHAGGGLLAYHAGLASYPVEGAYRRLIGGGFLFHPSAHPKFLVSPEPIAHPILEGVSAFSIVDEQYFVERDTDSTLALASASSSRFGSSCAAWCAERGAGRVACVTPGHRPESLGDPNLVRLLRNSARWCLGLGAAREGA